MAARFEAVTDIKVNATTYVRAGEVVTGLEAPVMRELWNAGALRKLDPSTGAERVTEREAPRTVANDTASGSAAEDAADAGYRRTANRALDDDAGATDSEPGDPSDPPVAVRSRGEPSSSARARRGRQSGGSAASREGSAETAENKERWAG